ncbi:MAG: Spy/CpxP family protein refolding chaperone [Deltaproteobacteria bacterium]|nr:Spy/CpxP family protein refolding chaperone [Deltaproteobacteria bacterium]
MKPTLIAVTLVAVAASACGGPWRSTPAEREARTTKHIETLLTDIDATPEQETRILALTTSVRERLHSKRDPSKGARAVVAAQWSSEQPDAAVVAAAVDQSAALRIADAHAIVDAAVGIHQTLTIEQRSKLEEQLPLKRMRFAAGLAQKLGYGPPSSSEELSERAQARFTKVLDELEATEEQRAALQPLFAAVVDDAGPLASTPETVKETLVSAWQTKELDADDVAALHALVDDEAAKVTLAAQSASRALLQAHAILTVDQRALLKKRLERGGMREHNVDDDVAAPAPLSAVKLRAKG